MKLPPDWNEFIGLLCANQVRFLIAHALPANGRPRATQDLDILVEPTAENAMRLGQALDVFGFPALARESHRFAEPERMATLGLPPLRIDIMTSITGVGFDQAWQGRLCAQLGEHQISFLGRDELLANKRASGRPKDLADVALLGEINDE